MTYLSEQSQATIVTFNFFPSSGSGQLEFITKKNYTNLKCVPTIGTLY